MKPTLDKPVKNLTDADIEGATILALVQRLTKLNPFAGYTSKDRRDVLERTLKNYRDR